MIQSIANQIRMLSVMDEDIDLFEGQYPVPNGVSYNTYLIEDGATVLLDTVDVRRQTQWMETLREALSGRTVDMLVISHMEPDHAGSVRALVEAYPDVELIGNDKTFMMLDQYAQAPLAGKRRIVKEGDTLCVGSHTLHFVMAPMVHWPEVMVCYEEKEHVLFSADGFGSFGAPDETLPWEDEARRYYANIVGKYGVQVRALMKKASALAIETVCPLHGPVLRGEMLKHALERYGEWASWTPQEKGVLVAYACFHGHTAEAAKLLADELQKRGESVALIDLARVHKSYAVSEAFRYDRIVLAATTYDGSYAPAMEAFLTALKAKNLQNRTVALIENGSWAPVAAMNMRRALEGMKNLEILEGQVTLRSAMSGQNKEELSALAQRLTEKN